MVGFEEAPAQQSEENAALKKANKPDETTKNDPFAAGVVWVGKIAFYDSKKGPAWALSISKREGEKFEGAVATARANGEKFEFPVTGRAPSSGNGVVVIESPLMGREKYFGRGTLRNGKVALSISVSGALGKKGFGDATLSPKN